MKHLNLLSHSRNPAILSSLAWNAVRDSLNRQTKGDLMKYILSIKVTDTRITIKTGKPIINTELSHYRENIQVRIEESFRVFGIVHTERKIIFT
jgi:hypothetical protein